MTIYCKMKEKTMAPLSEELALEKAMQLSIRQTT
jgi:hypothetical protein